MRKHFRITQGTGFHIVFPNGVVLSTQFGYRNYCENQDNIEYGGYNGIPNFVESNDVEIAIWLSDNPDKWITREMAKDVFGEELHDDVMGWINIADWLKIVEWCKNYKGAKNESI